MDGLIEAVSRSLDRSLDRSMARAFSALRDGLEQKKGYGRPIHNTQSFLQWTDTHSSTYIHTRTFRIDLNVDKCAGTAQSSALAIGVTTFTGPYNAPQCQATTTANVRRFGLRGKTI
jgi:hypothetical protein